MGTSEDVRPEQHARAHHQLQHDRMFHPMHQQHQQHATPPPTPQYSAGQVFPGSPSSLNQSASWPHEKLTESDVSHTQSMDVDPSHDPNSPSPKGYNGGSGVFHFGESTQGQHNYMGLVATPITRFLTKQTFGFIPKPSFPSPSEGVPPRSAPSSPLPMPANGGLNRKIPSLRLPSLSSGGSVPQSPLSSPQSSFSLPPGEKLSHLFGAASLESNNGSLPGSPMTLPARGSTLTLPPLKRACMSPTTLPPLSQLQLDDICKPFVYQRSLSCPSDAMVRAAADESTAAEAQEAYAVPSYITPKLDDVRKHRVERSNSVDASAVLAMREARARALNGECQTWLERPQYERHPLASLAESAHAMQMMEQGRSNLDSPRSITSPSASGEESSNPFSVSEDHDYRRDKKLCAFPRCSSNAVTRGLCISHGGGRRCQRKGCTRGAQSKGLCVAHGGGRICKAKGCSNIQRSMGLCIRHGGGKRCSMPGCQKGVVRQDLCTAHGGKRKCKVEDCNKHVKKKGLCRSHANSVLGASAMSSPRGDMSPEYSN